jgi:hypothetical protein
MRPMRHLFCAKRRAPARRSGWSAVGQRGTAYGGNCAFQNVEGGLVNFCNFWAPFAHPERTLTTPFWFPSERPSATEGDAQSCAQRR